MEAQKNIPSARRTHWKILGARPVSTPRVRRADTPLGDEGLMRWAQARHGMNAEDAYQYLHPLPPAQWDALLAPYAAWGQPEGSAHGLRDIEAAASKLADAVQTAASGGKAIGISGDYDCDGNCSTALMVRFLQSSGVPAEKIHVHIPNRKAEGYGVNRDAVAAMDGHDVGTLITVDNGTLAHAPLEDAVARGMHAIVIDHHPNSPDHSLPNGPVVVNPKRADEPLKHDKNGVADLAAVGVSWLVARRATEMLQARGHYAAQQLPMPEANDWLGLVALATVGDVVNMRRPLNRALVSEGLQVIRDGRDPYIKALAEASRVPDILKLKASDIAFSLTPVVNAPGRLGQSVAWAFLTPPDATATDIAQLVPGARNEVRSFHRGLQQAQQNLADQSWLDSTGNLQKQMLWTLREGEEPPVGTSPPPALSLSQHTLLMLSVQANERRKLIETALVRQALPQARTMLGDDPDNPQCETLLLAGEHWHEGVIGIVAGRLKEEFNMPVMVASIDPVSGMCKASARSVRTPDESVDIGTFVRDACENKKLMTKAGGHPMAAGCSFKREHLEAIRAEMEAQLGPAARHARLHHARPLAGALNLVEMNRASNQSMREQLHAMLQAQTAAEPFGEGAEKPVFALFGARIGPLSTARNGRDLSFTVTPDMPLAADAIRVSAFKAVGTTIETLLRAAERAAEPMEYVLVGTLEHPYKDGGDVEFRLDDVVAVPLQGVPLGMTQRNAAVAAALGTHAGALHTLLNVSTGRAK